MRKDSHWDATVDRPWIGKMEAWSRRGIYGLTASLLRPSSKTGFDFKVVRKILLVKEPYRMGDLFQITPTLRALKAWNPGLKVGLVVQDRNALLFEGSPHVDFLYPYQKRLYNRAPWKILEFFQNIRREKYELAVTLETQRVHLTNDLIAFFSGAPHRLRYDGQAFENPESNAFYDVLSPFDSNLVHEVDKNCAVFKPYGLILKDRSLFLKITGPQKDSARNIIKRLFTDYRLPITDHFTVIHPGSFKITNRWPVQNYIAIAQALQAKGRRVLFILGPSERNWKADLAREGFPVLDQISILEMAGILSLSDQVICNDTGVMHIAGAVGARTLALFGETNPEQWKPPGDSVRFLRGPDKKITSVTVEAVLQSISQ